MAGSPSYYYSIKTKELQKNIEEELKKVLKREKNLKKKMKVYKKNFRS